VDTILHVWSLVLNVPQLFVVGVVVCEEKLRLDIFAARAYARRRGQLEVPVAKLVVLGLRGCLTNLADRWLFVRLLAAPSPSVSKPHMGYNVKRRWLWATIVCSHTEQKLLGVIRLLCSFDKDIPVSIVIKDACINDVVFVLKPGSFRVLVDQVLIREFALGQFVEEFHVRVLQHLSVG
jgi:hypothetical protein